MEIIQSHTEKNGNPKQLIRKVISFFNL